MVDPQGRIRLYRTLIALGLAVALASLVVALFIGVPITTALWVPASYAFLAWLVYRIVLNVWARLQGDPDP